MDDTGKLIAADEIVIWLSTSFDYLQIALAWLPAFLTALNVDPAQIKMIQFTAANDVDTSESVNTRQLAAGSSRRRPGSPKSNLAELQVVLGALTTPEPDRLITCDRPAERLPS